MSVKKALQGNDWSQRIARWILPHVVAAAGSGSTIEYGECRDIVEKEHGITEAGRRARLYGRPAGIIGDACEAWANESGERIPPLNAIIVNSRRHLPSQGVTGYVKRYLGVRRNPSDADLGSVIHDVLEFSRWNELLALASLKPVRKLDRSVPAVWNFRPPAARGEESVAHDDLKRAAARSPEFFGVSRNMDPEGVTERDLPPGDRLDVFFEQSRVAIEVKAANSPTKEIRRGVWQAAKYLFILQKMQEVEGHGGSPRCILLLADRLPSNLRNEVRELGVEVVEDVCVDPSGTVVKKVPSSLPARVQKF